MENNCIDLKCNANEILFLVGAGISLSAPSKMPNGNDLTKFILEKACGTKEADLIFDLWRKVSGVVSEYNSSLKYPLLRLETVLGCINEIDKLTNRKPILQGLTSFSKTPYNINHKILSEFLSSGSNIITTNFDLGIENAYEEKGKPLKYSAYNSFSQFSSDGFGSIYHLHGCSKDSLDILGATVEKVKRGFDEKEKGIIDALIAQSKIIIFLGYSISDSFDITPYFEELHIQPNCICFIQHDAPGCEYPVNLNRLWSKAKIKMKGMYNTSKYLYLLCQKILGKDIIFNENASTYKWIDAFNSAWNYEYSDGEKLLNVLGIRYHIGFNIELLNQIRPNIRVEVIALNKKHNYTTHILKRYFTDGLRDFNNREKPAVKLPIKCVQEKTDYINQEYLSSFNSECKFYFDKYSDNSVPVNSEDEERIRILTSLLESYSSYPFSKVQYISYISASLKYLALFKSRFEGTDYTDACKRELMLSLDISYIEGIINALTHYAQHCINLKEINHTEQYNSNIESALSSAYMISSISGYYYHCVIIDDMIRQHSLSVNL